MTTNGILLPINESNIKKWLTCLQVNLVIVEKTMKWYSLLYNIIIEINRTFQSEYVDFRGCHQLSSDVECAVNPPLWLAVSSGRPERPSLFVSLRRGDSLRTDSHASDRSACDLSGMTQLRGFGSGRTWGCGSVCAWAAVAAPPSPRLPSRHRRYAPRAHTRQGSPRQFLLHIRI